MDKSANIKQCLASIVVFGYAKSLFGLYWISNSLLVDPQFLWLRPIAITGIPILVCIYYLFFGLLYYYLARNITSKPLKVVSFATLWVIVEIVSSFAPLGGFPWNLLGYAALANIHTAQLANVGTVFLLSFLVLLAAIPLVFIRKEISSILKATFPALLIIVGCYQYGVSHISYDNQVNTLKVKVVQPNVPQRKKWNSPIEELKASLNISKQGAQDYELLVWPETSIPQSVNLSENSMAVSLATEELPDNSKLISGLIRNNNKQAWNTAVVLDNSYGSSDEVTGIQFYDKHKLVPFGEYIPLHDWPVIGYLTKPFHYRGFSRGQGPKTLDVTVGEKSFKIALAICYEIIFPFQVVDEDNLPDILINITNDAWFGDSMGPPQHLMKSQMRAIELGIPVLRAANTGISAVIDKYGKIKSQVNLNQLGFIDEVIAY